MSHDRPGMLCFTGINESACIFHPIDFPAKSVATTSSFVQALDTYCRSMNIQKNISERVKRDVRVVIRTSSKCKT